MSNTDITLSGRQHLDSLLSRAKLISDSDHWTSASVVKSIHVFRYRNTVKNLLATAEGGATAKDFLQNRLRKINAYQSALQTLSQLEDLLKLTSSAAQVNILNISQTIVQTKSGSTPELNFDLLIFDEQTEMLDLLEKMKVTIKEKPKGVTSFALFEEPEEVQSLPIDEIPNINLIQQITPEDDYLPFKISIRNPMIQLEQTANKEAAKAFQGIGSALSDEEQKLINDAGI